MQFSGIVTHLDENRRYRVIAFFSRELSRAESDYTANDRELLGLIQLLQRFRCYLVGSEFEIFTDNQILKHFFTIDNQSRRRARSIEMLKNFGIFPFTLKPGKTNYLEDILSRAPDVEKICVNAVEVPFIDLKDFFLA